MLFHDFHFANNKFKAVEKLFKITQIVNKSRIQIPVLSVQYSFMHIPKFLIYFQGYVLVKYNSAIPDVNAVGSCMVRTTFI